MYLTVDDSRTMETKKNLDKFFGDYHHLISPFMYSQPMINLRNAQLRRNASDRLEREKND